MTILNPQTAYLQTAPAQYVNENNILLKSGAYISRWGKKALISGGVKALKSIESQLFPSLDQSDIEWDKHVFRGECSDENISQIIEKAEAMGADVIIGVGGGKALDSAKTAAGACMVPVVCIPTVAATCAATSAFSVIYTPEGEFKRDHFLTTNPNLVLVDPDVIANAPVEYFKSGIFDALSKWYEGRAVLSGIDNPDIYTLSAMKLAEILYNKTNEKAGSAVELVAKNQLGDSLVEVIDLNIYLTGVIQSLGQRTSRGAAAHAIHNGLTLMEESHELLHGIKVAYGIIVQLLLEEKTKDEIEGVLSFFRDLGLNPSLKGLGMPFDKEILTRVATKAANDTVMRNMPFVVEPEMVLEAMIELESR